MFYQLGHTDPTYFDLMNVATVCLVIALSSSTHTTVILTAKQLCTAQNDMCTSS